MTLATPSHLPVVPSGRRLFRRTVAAVAGAAALTAGFAGAASAATNGSSTTANVVVQSAITLTGLTSSFALTGIPGQTYNTASQSQTVHYTVATNNAAGYTVTVTPAANVLAATAQSNSNSIPITALAVTTDGTGYTPFVDSSTPVLVHSKTSESASAGDPLSSNFQVNIPFVHNDTYSATLNYLAATL